MEDILKELHEEILREMGGDSSAMESLGTSAHQLKATIESFMSELQTGNNINPYDFTNRVLIELDKHRRLKM